MMRLPRTKRARVAVVAAVVMAAAGAVAIGVATSAQPPESGPAVKSHAEHADIWSVDVKTKALTQQTLNANAREPTWSAGGDIAFSTEPCDECLSEIHVDGTGSSDVPVDTTIRHLFQPSWAPDGKRFAVVRLSRGIFIVDVQTRAATQLTTGPSDEAPDWQPNGEWIAFDRLVQNSRYELFLVHAGTGELRRLTRDSAQQTHPAWSPGGTKLAFPEQQSNGNWSIFTMAADGTGRKRVTSSKISAQEPAWSPDGKKIAFILQELDRATVAIVNADGTGSVTRLTDSSLFPSRPAWSPDGASVGFSATVVPK